MSSPNSKRNQSKTPVFLMAVLVFHHLANVLVDDSLVWWWHDATLTLAFALALTWISQTLPYSSLKWKCFTSAVAASSWVDVVYVLLFFIAGIQGYLVALCIKMIVFIGVFFNIWKRSYSIQSDILDSDHIFLLRRKPDNLQGIFMAFLGLPGGYSVYVDGMVYGYRKGMFGAYKPVSLDLSKYQVEKGAFINHAPDILFALNAMIGQDWKPWKNCMQIRKIWKGAH